MSLTGVVNPTQNVSIFIQFNMRYAGYLCDGIHQIGTVFQ
ncbi:Uncharacterised protein [Klebsiella pneumoniae]|nr:Uncharacterised protein [Klebsiella pneumoniae]SXD02202.1 Uncharacterised protein [Klebsiella quasipneumoniae]SYT33887.1 Uncharacterised protein [Klebsiella pneumoniae]SYV44151.1 Uncharacterised protein [Klebsiella pneumoniae]